MMTGQVVAYEPLLWCKLMGTNGIEVDLPFVIDTGFTHFLAMPQTWMDTLGLPLLSIGSVTLADNSSIPVSIYEGTIVWDGQNRTVEIHSMGGNPIIGMSLLYDFMVNLPIRNGNAFTITRMP